MNKQNIICAMGIIIFILFSHAHKKNISSIKKQKDIWQEHFFL